MRRLWLMLAMLLLTGCTAFQKAPAPVAPEPPAPSGPVAVRVEVAPAKPLTEIHFGDLQHGWASGAGFTIITDDGGQTWREGPRPDTKPAEAPKTLPADAKSACVVSPGVFVTATDSQVERSIDGGQTWTPVFDSRMSMPGQPGTIQCRGGAAWVMFYGGAGMSQQAYLVYRSADGGQTWVPMLVSGMRPQELGQLKLPAIDAYSGPFDAPDANTAFFLGSCSPCEGAGTSSITRTTDGGRTWQHDNIAYVRRPTALSFVDAEHGWIIADGRILATADGGKTWRQQYPAGGPVPAMAIAMVDGNTGYGLGAPGDAGALLVTHDGGSTWAVRAQLPLTEAHQPPVQPSLTLSFPDEQHGWVIHRNGRLLRSTDAGATWAESPLPAGISAVRGVAFATATAGCVEAAANDGSHTLFSSTDGGATWQRAPATGGVAGCAGALIGQDWRRMQPPGAEGFWVTLDARADGSAWVTVENTDKLWATRDSGKTWQQYTWPQDAGTFIQSLSYVGPGQGWAVTFDRRLIRLTGSADGVWQIIR